MTKVRATLVDGARCTALKPDGEYVIVKANFTAGQKRRY